MVYFGLSPFPVIVTTRIISCLVGDSYKPSFATITVKGDNPRYISDVRYETRFAEYYRRHLDALCVGAQGGRNGPWSLRVKYW